MPDLDLCFTVQVFKSFHCVTLQPHESDVQFNLQQSAVAHINIRTIYPMVTDTVFRKHEFDL